MSMQKSKVKIEMSKCCLLYAGPCRASEAIVQNHISTFGDMDTYISCFKRYKSEWINSGFSIKEIYETTEVDFFETDWGKFRSGTVGQSGFWQFWNLRNVIRSVPKRYDIYIKCRSDLLFSNKFNLHGFDVMDKVLYCGSLTFHSGDWNSDNWINDQFYFGTENTMNVISDFVTNHYKKFRHESRNSESTISNETQLFAFLRDNGIGIEKFFNFPYSKNHRGVNLCSGYIGFQLEPTDRQNE